MTRIRPHSLGTSMAALLALGHSLWALLVWLGAAQWLLDFIFRLHMISPPFKIAGFAFANAAGLILFTACTGYLSGWVVAVIWNRFMRDAV